MKTVAYDFKASIFPWITGYIEITQRDIMLCYPNVTMWMIPDGKSKDVVPLRNISGISIERYSDWKKFYIGLGLAFVGALFFIMVFMILISSKSLMGIGKIIKTLIGFLILLMLGILLMMDSANKCLIIFCSGVEYDIEVPFFEEKKLFRIQNSINKALDYEADKYDINLRKEDLAEEIGKAVGKALNNDH